MPPTDDDDAARRAAKGTTERASFPGLPKLVLGVQVPARQEQDETPAATPEARARARARRNTLAGMPAPAPQVTLPPPPVPKRPYQRSVSPVPWDDPPEARREAARHGDRVVTAPLSVPPPSSAEPTREPRWYHSAKGTIAVVGALSVAIPATVTGTTAAVVSVINALRQPTDPKLREDVDGMRKELGALRTYLADRDAARARELEQKFDALRAKDVELDLRYPAPRVDVLRPPK